MATTARGPPRGGAGDPGSTRRPRDTGPAASKVQPTSPSLRLCGSVGLWVCPRIRSQGAAVQERALFTPAPRKAPSPSDSLIAAPARTLQSRRCATASGAGGPLGPALRAPQMCRCHETARKRGLYPFKTWLAAAVLSLLWTRMRGHAGARMHTRASSPFRSSTPSQILFSSWIVNERRQFGCPSTSAWTKEALSLSEPGNKVKDSLPACPMPLPCYSTRL